MTNKDNTRYAKLSTELWLNAKWQLFASANPHAAVIWVTALSYSADRFTDGYFDAFVAMRNFAASQDDLDALVDAGLLDLTEDGMYHIHDYEQYQTSSAQIADISAKRSAAGKQGGRPKTVANTSEKANGNQTESKPKASGKQNKANGNQTESKAKQTKASGKLNIEYKYKNKNILSPIVPLPAEQKSEKQNKANGKQTENQIQNETQSKNQEPALEPEPVSTLEQDAALASEDELQDEALEPYIELESIIDDDITPVDEAEPCPKQPIESSQTDETVKHEQIPMSARKRRTQGNLVNLNQHHDMPQTHGQPLARNNHTQPTSQLGGKWGNTRSRDKPDKMTANLHHNLTMVAQMRALDQQQQQQAQEQTNYVNA